MVIIVRIRNVLYPSPRPTGSADKPGGSCKIDVNIQGPHCKLLHILHDSSLLRPRGSLHSVHRSLTPVPVLNNLRGSLHSEIYNLQIFRSVISIRFTFDYHRLDLHAFLQEVRVYGTHFGHCRAAIFIDAQCYKD